MRAHIIAEGEEGGGSGEQVPPGALLGTAILLLAPPELCAEVQCLAQRMADEVGAAEGAGSSGGGDDTTTTTTTTAAAPARLVQPLVGDLAFLLDTAGEAAAACASNSSTPAPQLQLWLDLAEQLVGYCCGQGAVAWAAALVRMLVAAGVRVELGEGRGACATALRGGSSSRSGSG